MVSGKNDVPFDLSTQEAQRRIELDLLSLVCQYPGTIDFVRDYANPDHISDSEVGKLIKDYIFSNGVAPMQSLVQDVFGDASYTPDTNIKPKDIRRILDNIEALFRTELFRKKLPTKLSKCKTATDALDVINEAAEILSNKRVDEDSENTEKYGNAFWDDYNENNGMLNCGIKTIDDNLFGKFQYTDLIIVCADTGLGKTTFVLNILNNFSKAGVKVAIFELEMRRHKLLGRISLSECVSFNGHTLSNKQLSVTQQDELNDFLQRFGKRKTFVIIDNVFDFRMIKEQIRYLAESGTKVIALDYMQLMMDDPTSVKEIEMITRNLKRLAMKFGILIILIAQFKNADNTKIYQGEIIKREPELEDIKGGSAMRQNADRIFFLYHDHRLNENEYVNEHHIEFIVKKERNGNYFRKFILFVRDKQLFKDCREEFVPPWKRQGYMQNPPKFKK